MSVVAQGEINGVNFILNALKQHMDVIQLTEHINLFSFSGGSAVMFSVAGERNEATSELIKLADVNAVTQATPEYLEKPSRMIMRIMRLYL